MTFIDVMILFNVITDLNVPCQVSLYWWKNINPERVTSGILKVKVHCRYLEKKTKKPLWTLFSKFSSEEDNLKMHFGWDVISKVFYIHLGLEMFDPELKILGMARSTQMFKPVLKIFRLACTFVINFIFTSYVKYLCWSYFEILTKFVLFIYLDVLVFFFLDI